jgi:hypothetical protein
MNTMIKYLGAIFMIWFLSTLFVQSFRAADRAATATLGALEAAAVASQKRIEQQ